MNINFDSATYNALLNRAKAEGKSIPKLVNELLITVLTKEELNEPKHQNNCRSKTGMVQNCSNFEPFTMDIS
ncbi:hypothetical protein ACOAMA_04500 [Escherichia coli]|uniref:hypothetical protein n=1 Tax=Escherichia coli TaxID=562 RepID=UPI001EC26AC3|nr:hypothetical protein [Escherichia coli]EHH8798230.1 hypothetical protein [Escherichia coli]MCX1663470.1 hypothetical protein [Escherichia coli]